MSNSITFHSHADVNAVVWITSLRESEMGVTRRIVEDLEPFIRRKEAIFQHHVVETAAQFLLCLDCLAIQAYRGLLPIIHLDAHGSAEDGLHIAASGENIPWHAVIVRLRRINWFTRNNLCIVSMACYSIEAAHSITLEEETPFYFLAAPKDEISAGFVEEKAFEFYERVFEHEELIHAYETILSEKLQVIHCERLLVNALIHYIRDGCVGKAGRKRREELLTAVLKLNGDDQNKAEARQIIDERVRPSQALLDRYVNEFLLGKSSGITIEQIEAIARAIPRDPNDTPPPSVEDSLREYQKELLQDSGG